MNPTNNTNWKTFSILLALSLASVACVFPYVLTVQGELIKSLNKPLWLLFVAQFVQTAVLFAVSIFFGLKLAKRSGFQLPILEGAPENRKPILKSILAPSIFTGIAMAVSIFILDYFFTIKGASISTHQNLAPIWQKLLAAVYGGVSEEIIMRLFVMTLFIWLGTKLARREQPSNAIIIVSIVLAAVIFGLGHLPITASVAKIDALIVARAIILNGIAGIAFGWLFWKKGLESAMIAHFTADIFLLTLLPLIFG